MLLVLGFGRFLRALRRSFCPFVLFYFILGKVSGSCGVLYASNNIANDLLDPFGHQLRKSEEYFWGEFIKKRDILQSEQRIDIEG